MDGKISSRNSSHGQHLGKKSGNRILRIMIDLDDLCSSVYLFSSRKCVRGLQIFEKSQARQGRAWIPQILCFSSYLPEERTNEDIDSMLGLAWFAHTGIHRASWMEYGSAPVHSMRLAYVRTRGMNVVHTRRGHCMRTMQIRQRTRAE